MKKLIPLILFVVIAVFLYFSLNTNSSKLPSPLLGKMFPNIEAKDFYSNESVLVTNLFSKKMSLVNVWASWCVTCRQEHHMMMKIANYKDLQLIGINYKDTRIDSERYLEMMGNPFDVIFFDPSGNIGLDLGVYATPETFLVDQQGVILHKHIGAIDSKVWEEDFVPHIKNKII
jgi:cytochrome c biogenesis protein CcmG/thiol:disulfide interchange protein DsbE